MIVYGLGVNEAAIGSSLLPGFAAFAAQIDELT